MKNLTFYTKKDSNSCVNCPLSKVCNKNVSIDNESEKISITDKEKLYIYILIFLLPIILMLTGGIIFKYLNINSIFGIFLGLILAFVIIHFVDKYITRSKSKNE